MIAARGTSDNAARYAKYLFGAANGLPVALATPSLFTLYQRPPRLENALVLGISQSGASPAVRRCVIKESSPMADSQLPADDIRSSNFSWLEYSDNGKPNREFLDKLDAVRDVLTSGGRTLVQGTLAWLWGWSQRTIPIPGLKTVAQIEENVAAMDFGPLPGEQMIEIDALLGR